MKCPISLFVCIVGEIPVQDIITSLTGTAVFKWFIKPPPEGAWVTVSNRDGEVLFVVMGSFTDIRESYKGRLQVSGNIHKGVIEFLLTKCNYVDEGTYIATYADQNFIGPKLIICKYSTVLILHVHVLKCTFLKIIEFDNLN